MPKTTRRPRPPDVITDPESIGGSDIPQSMKDALAAILPQPDAINFQEVIRLAEQILPPDALAAAAHMSLALAKADHNRMPAPPEAFRLLQNLASARVAPDAFKFLRTQFGVSQQEIAQACGVHRNSVIRWEQGESTFPPQAIHALFRLVAARTAATKPLTGNDILSLRQALGYSQPRLAEKLGVAPLTIFNWEKRGDRPLPHSANTKHAAKLAELAELANAA